MQVRWLAAAVRTVVPVAIFRADEVVAHYSIPAFDEAGGPRIEDPQNIESDKLSVEAGDVLISKLNPRKSRVQVVRPHDVPAIASTEFVVLRPFAVDARYLAYALRSDWVRQVLDARVQSVTRSQQRVDTRDVMRLDVPAPSRSEQQSVSDFLDREMARIRTLLERLAEYVAALDQPAVETFRRLTEAMPKGRIGYRFDVQLGKMLDEKRIDQGDVSPYLRNANVHWDRLVLDDVKAMTFDGADKRKFELHPGDLLVCEGGEPGRAAVWHGEIDGCYYQKALHRVRPRGEDSVRFLLWALRDLSGCNAFRTDGPGRYLHLTAEQLRGVRIPMPPAAVQHRIAERVDREAAAAANVRAKAETLRDRLAEYRDALVSEMIAGALPRTVEQLRRETLAV